MQDDKIKGKNCFVYKTITCPIRANILDVYSNLVKWIVILADLVVIYVKAWYLCRGLLVMRSVLMCACEVMQSEQNFLKAVYAKFCMSYLVI